MEKGYTVFEKIEREITQMNLQKPFIIGVNGVDTSGKTSFSQALSEYLKGKGYHVALIHLDDFHNCRAVKSQADNEIDGYFNHAFNLELLEEEILHPIHHGGYLNKELTLLNLDTDTYINEKHYYVDRGTIVIVEGVLLYRAPIDQYFDYRIFLHIDFPEVLRRAEQRDVPKYGVEFLERYHKKYIPVQEKYLSMYQPKEKSNLVIDNTDWHVPQILS
ncbi:MAG: hypothetical protein ACOYVK_07260 [Bacillota bacterium]